MEKEIVDIGKVNYLVDEFAAKYPAILSQFEVIVGMSRGGLVPAALLATYLGKPLVVVYIDKEDRIYVDRVDWVKGKNALVVDDIIRTGKTLRLVKEYLEKNVGPASMQFFALYAVTPLRNTNYDFPAFAQKTDKDVIFPWDH
ncbi:MAG: phosphoribosyltransferase [Candidatus Pacebacteria bacterium]|jgi:hypoxanthine phosphoribosyltransferase|nr:phosphoribosyltransferase [Candidatus Paceibacterota bacterium]